MNWSDYLIIIVLGALIILIGIILYFAIAYKCVTGHYELTYHPPTTIFIAHHVGDVTFMQPITSGGYTSNDFHCDKYVRR